MVVACKVHVSDRRGCCWPCGAVIGAVFGRAGFNAGGATRSLNLGMHISFGVDSTNGFAQHHAQAGKSYQPGGHANATLTQEHSGQ